MKLLLDAGMLTVLPCPVLLHQVKIGVLTFKDVLKRENILC